MQLIMQLHTLSTKCNTTGLRPLTKLLDGLIRLTCAARLPVEAQVHPTVVFSHNGLAVVVTKETVMGRGCQIGTHVIIGSNWPAPGAPILEEDVIVGPGAIILGPITLGRGCVVAAGSVVLANVPPRVLVAGSPATIKKQNISSERYRYPKA